MKLPLGACSCRENKARASNKHEHQNQAAGAVAADGGGAVLVGDITTAEQSVSQRYAQLETQITRHLQPLSIPDNNKQCNVLPV